MTEYGKASDYSNELKRIIRCVKRLRTKSHGEPTSWESAAECHLKYSNLHGESVLALTITLSPTGCEWARRGGCTMCGEYEGAERNFILSKNPLFHISQFASAIGDERIWKTAKEQGSPIAWLRINQEGNYTNAKEVNMKAQSTILRLATRIGGIKRITIESRPQYINEETVSFLSKLVDDSGVELEVGMGLEAENDVVRNVCINKQGTKEQFVKAVKALKKFDIKPLAYVLLKPPFLTEGEAIEEAVATAHYAYKIGYERISLEPMSIHKNTLVHALTKTGDYKAPWLWSVIEVVKRCSDISGILGVGGIGYYPVPQEYSGNICKNAETCAKQYSTAIIEYNRLRDIAVFDGLQCNCKTDWIQACKQRGGDLKDRMNQQLLRVERYIPNRVEEETVRNDTVRNSRLLFSYNQ